MVNEFRYEMFIARKRKTMKNQATDGSRDTSGFLKKIESEPS